MNKQQLETAMENAVLARFPNSYAKTSQLALGDRGFCIRFALGKDKGEWSNGIFQNDPMSTTICIHGSDSGDGYDFEFRPAFSHIKPDNPHHFCKSEYLRSASVKNGDAKKVLAVFEKQLDKLKVLYVSLLDQDKFLKFELFDPRSKI